MVLFSHECPLSICILLKFSKAVILEGAHGNLSQWEDVKDYIVKIILGMLRTLYKMKMLLHLKQRDS